MIILINALGHKRLVKFTNQIVQQFCISIKLVYKVLGHCSSLANRCDGIVLAFKHLFYSLVESNAEEITCYLPRKFIRGYASNAIKEVLEIKTHINTHQLESLVQ